MTAKGNNMTMYTRLDQTVERLQVTIKEAARLLSYDERTIRRLIVRRAASHWARAPSADCVHEPA